MEDHNQLPDEWQESYDEALAATGEALNGVVVDHYERELHEYIESLPSSARGRYTMQSLAGIKQNYTAKEFMWLTPSQKLNLFRTGSLGGEDGPDCDWED